MNSFIAQDFSYRHIGPSKKEERQMLDFLGITSTDQLIDQTVPQIIALKKDLSLPQALSERDLITTLKSCAQMNQNLRSLLGLGFHDTHTPSVIKRHILENPGWYTQYTPYQPEISQGRLESLLNFQTMICDLTGLEVANASLLDEASACGEAMGMAMNLKNKDGSKVFFVDKNCHPAVIEVVSGRAECLGLGIVIGDHLQFNFETAICGALVSYPDTNGKVQDLRSFIDQVHKNDGLAIVCADLLSLTLLAPPAEMGADVIVGSAQRFGLPLGYGGPHAAYMATKEEFKRNLPGRIVGVSKDKRGRKALRLALQTREQHIRREKATSNICTAQALLANMAAMYGIYHGPDGLFQIAAAIHEQARILAAGFEQMGLSLLHKRFFDTIAVRPKAKTPKQVIEGALKAKINLRPVLDDYVLIALDEKTTKEECEQLWSLFGFAQSSLPSYEQIKKALTSPDIELGALWRRSAFLTHPVFNSYRSETQLMRYIKELEVKDLSLTSSMIPLGSCTMKLNAAVELEALSWPEFGGLHPFAPKDQAKGYFKIFEGLESILKEVTGFDGICFEPNSGAQGEYAGLCAVRAYLKAKGQSHRKICLIPSSAHGTNPASAAMAGFKVVVVACTPSGNIDQEDLKAKIAANREQLGVFMMTYPSTYGVFEEAVSQICQMIHDAGGQVYMDGANMNAQVGLCRPGDYGPDLCHLNLHKTFCIPHGGGGPGMGPIAVKSHLIPHLPAHKWLDRGSFPGAQAPVSGSPYSSASILLIPYSYCMMMGASGLKKATKIAILNANYIAKKLEPFYPILYKGANGRVAHECIIDIRPFKETAGVEAVDVAKRLMDYGFHAPTLSFPVPGTLMIEPTESEDKKELDRFCDSLIAIRKEIDQIAASVWDKQNNPLKQAPHTMEDALEETWDRPYSRKQALTPLPHVEQRKFWPSVGRVDEAYGDRNFICVCPEISSYES